MLVDKIIILLAILALLMAVIIFVVRARKNAPLTTRQRFIKLLGNKLDKQRRGNSNFVLFFIDLDNFKTINETLGHAVGDQIIDNVFSKLQKLARGKYAQYNAMVSSLGGDEYVVLLQGDLDNSTKVSKLAKELLTHIAEPFVCMHNPIYISCSIGIGMYPTHATNAKELFQCADSARYAAKQMGRNTFVFYSKDLREKTIDNTTLSADIRQALKEDQFVLFFQPQVAASTNRVVGAEALIRWQHPSRGWVSPEIFIPVAEQSGLIMELGNWIIKSACCKINTLHQELGFDDLKIAINLSAYQFIQGDVAEKIAKTIWDTGINPKKVELELTESMVMGNPEKSMLMLSVLTAMGIEVAIDDFGTGYSSLSQLKRFPINYLKIDQSFVKGVDRDPENHAIIAAIIAMAKSLNLKVIAEGVENQAERAVLLEHSCDILQGYFFSKPLTFADFAQFAKDNLAR